MHILIFYFLSFFISTFNQFLTIFFFFVQNGITYFYIILLKSLLLFASLLFVVFMPSYSPCVGWSWSVASCNHISQINCRSLFSCCSRLAIPLEAFPGKISLFRFIIIPSSFLCDCSMRIFYAIALCEWGIYFVRYFFIISCMRFSTPSFIIILANFLFYFFYTLRSSCVRKCRESAKWKIFTFTQRNEEKKSV